MTRILLGAIGPSLLLLSSAVSAETPGTIQNSFYSQDEYQLAHRMFDKVKADVHQAQSNAYPDNPGDNSSFNSPLNSPFNRARTQLDQLEQSWDRAIFDSREIEATISTLQTIENNNRLVPQDRDVLDADISRLLDFRTDYY